MSRNLLFSTVCAGALVASALCGAARADDAAKVDEVIVTAQKVRQRAVDVPASVAVFQRSYFENTRTSTFEELSRATPGLIVNESIGASYTAVAIRGIGSDALNNGVEPSVGVFIDGVYQARPAFLGADLADVERIEVLRGPQGTLYGKNTDAGAINLITRSSSRAYEASARLYVGNYDSLNLQGVVSGPVSDRVRARISAYSQTRDSYIDNTISGTGGDSYKRQGLRLALDVDASDHLTLAFKASVDRHDASEIKYSLLKSSPTLDFLAGLFGVSLPNSVYDRKSAANFRPHERLDLYRTSLNAVWDLGEGRTLTSITGYQWYRDNNITDVDYLAFDFLDGGNVTSQNQFSQELRLNNDPSARFSYVIGLFYFRQNQKDRGFNTVLADLDAITGGAFPAGAQDLILTRSTVESASVFGQGTWRLNDRLSATLGLRYDDQKNHQDRDQPLGVTLPDLGRSSLSKSEGDLSGTFSLRYALTPEINAYATASRGFKGGGYNGFGVPSADTIGFDAEEATNYEVGVKGSALDRRLRFAASLYHTKIKNLQVSNFDGANFIVGNAASATTRGVELSATLYAMTGLTFDAGLNLGEAVYDSYPGAPCTASQSAVVVGICTQNLAGRPIAYAPRAHATFAAQYERDIPGLNLDLFARADLAHFGGQYLQTALAPETRQGAYTLVNARIGLQAPSGAWGVYLTGANLTAEKFLRNAYDYPLFSGAYLAAPGQPRTWGIELKAAF